MTAPVVLDAVLFTAVWVGLPIAALGVRAIVRRHWLRRGVR